MRASRTYIQQKAPCNRLLSLHESPSCALQGLGCVFSFCVLLCIREREGERCSVSPALVRTCTWLRNGSENWPCSVCQVWIDSGFIAFSEKQKLNCKYDYNWLVNSNKIVVYKCNVNKYKLSTGYCWNNYAQVNFKSSSEKAQIILWAYSSLPRFQQ